MKGATVQSAGSRRGMALLLMLALLIIALVGMAALARAATTARLARGHESSLALADDLLPQAERAIEWWLLARSAEVVLPPNSASPSVTFVDDVVLTGSTQVRLRITAFDQLGMAPYPGTPGWAGLSSAIPSEIEQAIAGAREDTDELRGLDRLQELVWREAASSSTSLRVFPLAASRDTRVFSSDDLHAAMKDNANPSADESDANAAVGSYVRTHAGPPLEDATRPSRHPASHACRININTAPPPLLRRALNELGRGGLDAILRSREKGERAGAPRGGPGVVRSGEQTSISLVATSNVWAFKIDIMIGRLSRSWWCVYTHTTQEERRWFIREARLADAPRTGREEYLWIMRQRLAVTR